MLTLDEIHSIVNAVLEESERNEEFKVLALSNVEQAIRFIIERDFSSNILERYNKTVKYYEKGLNLNENVLSEQIN